MLRHCISIPLLVFLVACTPTSQQELPHVTLVVTNGSLIDGTGADPIADGLVAINENRIVAVGPSTDYRIPPNVKVIDIEGATILPGFFNAHSHKATTPATRRLLFLLDGTTSVCDLATPLNHMPYLDKEEINSKPAARGFKAGPIVTVPGGYPGPYFGTIISYEIQGEEEAKLAVIDLHARGADYIKVALEPGLGYEDWPVLNLSELRSIVTTAHAHDLPVRAHVTQSAMLEIALDADVDVIEHVPMPSHNLEELDLLFDDAGDFRPFPKLQEQLIRIVDQEVVLVPTLDVMMLVGDSFWSGDIETDPEIYNRAVRGIVRYFHESGGIIAVGNDYGNPGVQPGMPLREMELLHAAGLSPLEVIEAATQNAAYVCGQGDELGTLETGKLADLIVVDGDPLDDLKALDSVLYVVKDGEVVVSPTQEG